FAPQMGALAINDHVAMLNRVRQTEPRDDKEEKEKEKKAQALTAKIKDLTTFMEKSWPQDTGTDSARHTVGYLLRYERRYEDAAQHIRPWRKPGWSRALPCTPWCAPPRRPTRSASWSTWPPRSRRTPRFGGRRLPPWRRFPSRSALPTRPTCRPTTTPRRSLA